MATRKTTKTRKTRRSELDPAALDAVIALFVKGYRPERIAELLTADKSATIAPGSIDAYLSEARSLVTLAANYRRDEELGRAIRRYHDIYADATTAKEHRCRIDAQKELCRLMRLYEDPEHAGTVDQDNAAEVELEEIRGYLESLNLAAPGTPLAELARLAVEKITYAGLI